MVRDDTETLQRRWSIDLDTGKQTEDTFDRSVDLIGGDIDLSAAEGVEIGPIPATAGEPGVCASNTQRISGITIWLSPSEDAKPGDTFCVYTNDGSIALVELIAIHDTPQEVVLGVKLWTAQ